MRKEWSKLNSLQLGRYGEYFAKMEITSYGLDVYTSEVDDHGVDFIAKNKQGKFFEIQVKSIRLSGSSYVFMHKDKFNIEQENMLLILLIFEEGKLPAPYLIPAKEWQNENDLLKDKDYEGLKSKPEYGINISKKNMSLLKQYKLEDAIEDII